MRDTREAHQALDVRLPDGCEVAEKDRQDRNRRKKREHHELKRREGHAQNADKEHEARRLGGDAQERCDGRWSALIHVANPDLEGHCGDLEKKSRHDEHRAAKDVCVVRIEGDKLAKLREREGIVTGAGEHRVARRAVE